MKRLFIPSTLFAMIMVVSGAANARFNAKTPRFYEKGYGQISHMGTFHSWGHLWLDNDGGNEDDDKQETEYLGAIRMAGYAVLSDLLDIGGYFFYQEGNTGYEDSPYGWWGSSDDSNIGDLQVFGLGFAMKLGRTVAPRVRLGFGLDVGIEFAEWDVHGWGANDTDTMVGFTVIPRFDVDIIIFNAGGFKLGANASLGFLTRFHGGNIWDNPDVTARSLLFGPTMLIGVTLGG